MSGLLLKDLYILKKYGKTMVALILFFSLFAAFSKDAGFLSGMIIFVGTTMAINSFSYDDLSKWQSFALAMPVKRRTVVLAKYLFTLILAVGSTLFSVVLNVILGLVRRNIALDSILPVAGIMLGLVLFINAIILPLIYKFGVEKSRLLMIVVYALPAVFILSALNFGSSFPAFIPLNLLAALSPVLVAAVFWGSYLLSCRIYEKKEV